MAKAVSNAQRAFTVGQAWLGQHGKKRGSVNQQVHDGDTVIVDPNGNLSVRFLGVDTPEVSFTLPKDAVAVADRRPDESVFVPISDRRWARFLNDPFADNLPKLTLKSGLRRYIGRGVGRGAAKNHAEHVVGARELAGSLEIFSMSLPRLAASRSVSACRRTAIACVVA